MVSESQAQKLLQHSVHTYLTLLLLRWNIGPQLSFNMLPCVLDEAR